MELALYHPDFGYYARSDRRSGRAGDFFTSVDAGPLFGELLARQLEEMAALLIADCGVRIAECDAESPTANFRIANSFDLVEADAGAGRIPEPNRRGASAGLARRNQPVRLRMGSPGGAEAAPRIYHPDRLRPRSPGAVLGQPFERHADHVSPASERRPGECRPCLAAIAGRTGYDRARRLHQPPCRG